MTEETREKPQSRS